MGEFERLYRYRANRNLKKGETKIMLKEEEAQYTTRLG